MNVSLFTLRRLAEVLRVKVADFSGRRIGGNGMGMLYRRKQRNETGELVEVGPWWMKYYDNGRPVYQSTGTLEKREAVKVLTRAANKVLEGKRETPRMHRTKFEHLIDDLRQDYTLRGLKIWDRRENCLGHLKPVFSGMLAKAITTDKLKTYITKCLSEGAASYSRKLWNGDEKVAYLSG